MQPYAWNALTTSYGGTCLADDEQRVHEALAAAAERVARDLAIAHHPVLLQCTASTGGGCLQCISSQDAGKLSTAGSDLPAWLVEVQQFRSQNRRHTTE